MSNNRIIQAVTDTKDKETTYRTMLGRYKTAMKDGFYLEAILIDYAMLEDRMRSFIYYSGALANRNSLKINGPGRKYFVKIVRQENPSSNLGIMNISGKRNIIKCLIEWKESLTEQPGDRYLRMLSLKLEDLDLRGLLQTLDNSEYWCKYRNECIHSVMNKNMKSLGSDLESKAIEGMQYARFIDAQVKVLKRENRIRRSLGLANK